MSPDESATPIDEEVERAFTYHPPKGNQVQRYERLRAVAKDFAYVIVQACPDSVERSIALQLLNLATMEANAAIARNE